MTSRIVLVSSISFLLGSSAFRVGQIVAPSIGTPSVNLPKGQNAWAVHVVRVGGLTGDGSGDIKITSENKVTCGDPDAHCKGALMPSDFRLLSELILSSQFAKTKKQSSESLPCFDCFTTAITVRRREAKNKDRSYSGKWESSTTGTVPPDLIRIAQKVLALDL